VATAYRQFAAATQIVEEYVKRILPDQEQAARLIREGYRQGEFRLTEALLAQRDLFEARSAYLEAIATYNATRTELQRATGLRP
jgi:cobalt-zinc-cadmium efflux system outer membrane protein